MDAVLSKIKHTVSNALPGNALTREYDIGKQLGCAGPGMLWRLYAAKKRSTHEEATIWAVEKKCLDSFPKAQKETMLDILKHGVATLTRIKHPKILSVLQPLEESRDSLAFASEPLFTSLKTVLSSGVPKNSVAEMVKDFELTDTEIKYGLMQISEALTFLHSDCRRVHLNLVPEAILINRFGLWKLGAFEFSTNLCDTSKSEDMDAPGPVGHVAIWQSALMPSCQPALYASSPEAVLKGRVSALSDMFSLGLLICCLYNKGEPFMECGNDYSAYRRSIKDIVSIGSKKLSNLPNNVKEYVKMMLSDDPSIRPDALQFSRTPYFEDASMSILRGVDNMYQLDNLARSQFYKSLPSSIHTLPKRLCLYRLFPQITEDFSNPHMVPFVLPAVLQIMDMVSQEEFTNQMLPRLLPVFSMKEPIQITLIFLQNLRILSTKFPSTEFRTHVLPMLHSALDTDNKVVQELCLKSLPSTSQMMDLTMLKNAVLPRIQKLFFRADTVGTRLACLICIGKLLDHLDKWIVMDEVLPFLQQIKSREPSILMAVFAIYRLAFSHEKLGISRDKLASRILPHIIPLSIENSLNLRQYMAYADLIRDMCAQLEREQRGKLEQLHGMQDENSMVAVNSGPTIEWSSTNSCEQIIDEIMRLYVHSASNDLPNPPPPMSSKAAAEIGCLTTNSDVGEQMKGSTSPLTLEQKRQIAAERDQIIRLQNQPALNPAVRSTGPGTKNLKPVPRDLTSTLINSNMDAISSLTLSNKNNLPNNGCGMSLPLVSPPGLFNGVPRLPNYCTAPVPRQNNIIPSINNQFPTSTIMWNSRPPLALPGPYSGNFASPSCNTNSFVSLGTVPFAPMTAAPLRPTDASGFKQLSQNEIDDLLK